MIDGNRPTRVFDFILNADEELVFKIVEYFKAWEYFLLKPSWSYCLFGSFNRHVAAV